MKTTKINTELFKNWEAKELFEFLYFLKENPKKNKEFISIIMKAINNYFNQICK